MGPFEILQRLEELLFSSGVKSTRSSSLNPVYSKAAGLVGIGCVADSCSPGTVEAGIATLLWARLALLFLY